MLKNQKNFGKMIDMSEDLIKNSYNIQDIIKILPHRYPFVLIDRIDEVKQGEYVNAIKNVTINEPFFQGHFPENGLERKVHLL